MEAVRSGKAETLLHTLGGPVYAVEVERTSASASFDLGLTEQSNFSGLLYNKVLFKRTSMAWQKKTKKQRTRGCQGCMHLWVR